jgi:hypothetical protein
MAAFRPFLRRVDTAIWRENWIDYHVLTGACVGWATFTYSFYTDAMPHATAWWHQVSMGTVGVCSGIVLGGISGAIGGGIVAVTAPISYPLIGYMSYRHLKKQN